MMEIERKLVQNLIRIKYEDLPEVVVEMAKMTILDTLGALIGGAGAEGCLPLVNQLKEWAGVQESTIMIYGGKVPCPNAAFANSVMARALELDSPWAPGIHVSASTVPVSIATAEKCRPVGGKELITSIVLGEDFTARVNHAVSSYRGFDPTGVCTVLGATATAGRILGLDEQKMWNALAIAFNRSAGSFHGNIEGALTVRLIQGLTSRSGIESSLISMAGITGGRNFLVGKWGFFDLFSDGQFNRKAITAQLGKRFEGAYGVTFKRYPSCGATLSATEATLELVHKYDIKPDDVDEVTVELPPFYYDLVGHKFKIGDNPTVDAQFSIQYVVANSIFRRRSTQYDFEKESVEDPKVIALAGKVHAVSRSSLKKIGRRATVVSIKMRTGKIHSKTTVAPLGAADNPLTMEDLTKKFRDCANYATVPLSGEKIDGIIEMINSLEKMRDIDELVRLLVL